MNTPSEPAGWSRAELERVIKPLRRLLVAEREHAKRIRKEERKAGRSIGPIDVMSSRYAADLAHADLLSVTVADCDAIMALAPPSSLDGGEAGEPAGWAYDWQIENSGEPESWISGVFSVVKPGGPQHEGLTIRNVRALYDRPALAAAPLPVGEQGLSSSRDLRSDASPALEGWRTIDSAWREGEQRILLTDGCSVHAGYWYSREACWLDCDGIIPTHWQPLPQPPVQQTDSDKSRAEPPSPPLADGEPETP